MIRCPHCAAATHIHLDQDHVLLVGYNQDTFTIEKYPVTLGGKVAEVKDLVDLATQLQKHGISFLDHDHLVCPKCLKESTFGEYVSTWDNPGKYHDSDQLCWCGGELWYDKVPGTTRYAMVCEECEWVKPKAIIDGG